MEKERRDHRTRTIILGGNKMTTATAEKPTCKYYDKGSMTYIECKGDEWAEWTDKWTYCPHCGKAIERIERE